MLSAATAKSRTFGQNGRMLLDEAFRILEIPPSASDDEIRAAHRDLTKVWHPDRFGNDAGMQRKAEEKLKQINEALDVVQSARTGRRTRWTPPSAPSGARHGGRGLVVWVFLCLSLAFFILVRRPTLGGLIIAGALFLVAFTILARVGRGA
jgi:preprotein translocase subunit Sec63